MRRLKVIGLLLGIAGIVVIFISAVLPLVKLPQTLVKKGPSVELDEDTYYWIDTWILPPIDAGTPFSVELEANSPGGLSIAIFPSHGGEKILGSSPLLTYIFESDQQALSASMIAQMSSEYTMFIVCIRNNFTLTINSEWSPFYDLRIYLYFGLGSLPAGVLIIYYDSIQKSKERFIRESLKADSH
jgi:hypothetical protein